jgi:phosphohistidine phosphatase
MSKSIILMRHGKSSWAYDLQDEKRPLKDRGKNDAKLVAEDFKAYNIKVDKVYSSPAVRAYETCKIVHKTLGWDIDIVKVENGLYDFGGEQVINIIKNLPETYNTVMLFGHNHAFTSIANLFGNGYIDNLPTSGVVKINFEVDMWSLVENGKTEFVIIPKSLRDL